MLTRLLPAALALAFSTAAFAAGPQLKGQAPGWYRMQLGDFEITALSDGTIDLPVEKLLHQPPAKTLDALKHDHLVTPVETSVNAFLVNTGTKVVLVDTGTAGLFGPTAGRLLDNLKASGYKPEQVDEIVITHMHADHIGGASSSAFPNATLRLDKRDSEHWLAPAQVAKGDDGKAIAAVVKGFADAGRFKPFDGSTAGVEIVPGVTAFPAYGHTPGHSNYVAESKGQKIMFWGDLMHVAAVQFPHPAVTIQFDSDPQAARPAREKAFAEAAKGGYYVAVAHLSFPGIGHVRADGKGYDWVPANYSANR